MVKRTKWVKVPAKQARAIKSLAKKLAHPRKNPGVACSARTAGRYGKPKPHAKKNKHWSVTLKRGPYKGKHTIVGCARKTKRGPAWWVTGPSGERSMPKRTVSGAMYRYCKRTKSASCQRRGKRR